MLTILSKKYTYLLSISLLVAPNLQPRPLVGLPGNFSCGFFARRLQTLPQWLLVGASCKSFSQLGPAFCCLSLRPAITPGR